MTEDFEYAEILDKAAQCKDTCEQLAYVAAFTISSYSTTSNRTGKPFNPLLGETYECDRTDDLGWRCITEQVRIICFACPKGNNNRSPFKKKEVCLYLYSESFIWKHSVSI